MPPMLFDDGQAVALAVALQTAATGMTGTVVAEDAARALTTLRQVMPPRLCHRIDLLRITAVPPPTTRDTAQGDAQLLVERSRAIHAHEELRLDYTPAPRTSADGPRRVQPHHLVTWRHHWYLVAWDQGAGLLVRTEAFTAVIGEAAGDAHAEPVLSLAVE